VGDRPVVARTIAPFAQAFPLVRRALKILADREVSPQTGLLKSTLLQLDSTFSERNYGASSFLDFVEKLAQAGLVSLKHAGRSVMVELNEGFPEESGAPATATAPVAADAAPASAAGFGGPGAGRPAGDAPQATEVRATESAEAGVARARQILSAATNARWPMYLRNVKQILRQTEGGFDERRYGFGGLMDLLKALQRDGLVRIERDRRGGLRVFQGQALQTAARTQPLTGLPQDVDDVEVIEGQPVETQPGEAIEMREPGETERVEAEPIPIDTTAELLGRAKPRKPRARLGRQTPAPAPKKAAAKKPAARRAPKSRKGIAADTSTETER
jgi:hypothetical protein